jgi:hypothetical protein
MQSSPVVASPASEGGQMRHGFESARRGGDDEPEPWSSVSCELRETGVFAPRSQPGQTDARMSFKASTVKYPSCTLTVPSTASLLRHDAECDDGRDIGHLRGGTQADGPRGLLGWSVSMRHFGHPVPRI